MIINLLLTLFILTNLGLLLFDLTAVLLSYAIYWYEYANANADATLVKRRFSGKNIKLVMGLLSTEIFFNFITIMMIPFGLRNRQKPLTQHHETPILLLNGLFVNQSCWFWFKWQLKRHGFNNIETLSLSSWHSEEVLTELLAKRIDELRHQRGVNQVHLVGHSMGGMIARNYVQLRGGSDKVDQLICLGSAHHGSKLAPLSIDQLGKILIPGSDFLNRLNQAPIPAGVRLTNIYTRKDNMVLPNTNHHLSWGKAIEFDRMGHTALIYRKAIISQVAEILKEKKGEGQEQGQP
ncbi:MAG: alpha/beta fold hydrolase [Thermodesulfobacteriota bacterium]|nr:alpha/beta fold hydrolase [Thermodesulfobacteriota bacterium]